MRTFCASFLMLLATSLVATGRVELSVDPLTQIASPHVHVRQAAQTSPAGYTPTQIRNAYGFNKVINKGAGQKIAIIDAYGSPTIQADLDRFCTQFSLPRTTIQIAYPSGHPTGTDGGWALETALDVEWAHAIAPSATILLVVAKDAYLSTLLTAVDYAVQQGAKQISMSWGANEFSSQSLYDSHFNKAGVTFIASSGDSGAGVSWPAVSPYVTGVGGTSLILNSLGQIVSERAWSGSGGGKSAYTAKPSYQRNFQTSTRRMVPDVSYHADPSRGFCIYSSTPYGGWSGWFTVGGTSAGAPQWAALFALTNSSRTSSLSNADTLLYSLANGQLYWTFYRDIVGGNNGGYQAVRSYDEVTGLGSPISYNLVSGLVRKS
jgi:subtilase family serine protease